MKFLQRYRVWLAGLITLLSIGGSVLPTAAEAAQVTGCHMVACLIVYTGAKNYSNHTQLVQQVEVYSMGGSGFIEAWGQTFYRSTHGSQGVWTINQWEPSGSGVCGAVTLPGVPRRIACITISV